MIFLFSDSIIRKTQPDADTFEIKRGVTHLDVSVGILCHNYKIFDSNIRRGDGVSAFLW
jgi:hypothetical protein